MKRFYINHRRVWLAIIVGSLMIFIYYYNLNINHEATMQIVIAKMIINLPFIVIGAYIMGFFIKYATQIKKNNKEVITWQD